MKLKFDANLPYQQEAIQAAVGVFEGQPSNQSQFEVSFTTQMDMLEQTELGIGNRVAIEPGRILENTRTVQEPNDIPKSRDLGIAIYPDSRSLASIRGSNSSSYPFPNFSIEMETGTGKTYVYLRGIFELNQKYGFKKFIIVVPSVAIREGVLKSIEITKEHFAGIYDNVPFDNGRMIRQGEEEGGMTEEVMKAQIRESIERHLQKELKMKGKGIKVLSLFFIDRASNYRLYADDGTPQKGKIAKWFEEAFAEISSKSLYKGLLTHPVETLHNGYFSSDRKGVLKDTRGNTQADEDTYSLIMRDKERLLSPEEPLRFIFSHSALKEGWDNPNVFQLCSLRELGTERERRQTIGRGLRLPVNQDGERVYDDTINRLTVIAGETFEEYARGLQDDIERDCQIKFGRIEKTAFAKLVRPAPEGEEEKPIGQDASEKIWDDLKEKGYLDTEGDIQAKFDPAREGFVLELAPDHEPLRAHILDEMRKYIFRDRIVDARQKRSLRFKKEVTLTPEFEELWKRISKKTAYAVEFDTEELIKRASLRIKDTEKVRAVTISTTREELEVTNAGVQAGRVLEARTTEAPKPKALPDILAFLQRETELTRHTLVRVLKESGRLKDFPVNPQAFMSEVAKILNRTLHGMIVDGIKYERIAGQEYEMRLFEEDEIESYLANLYEVQSNGKTLYDYIPYDSEVEREFARQLDGMEDVRLFVKLPRWFVVDTVFG